MSRSGSVQIQRAGDEVAMASIPMVSALSAGELQSVVRWEARRILEECGGDRLRALKKGLELMGTRDLLSAREIELLQNILDTVFATAQKKREITEAYAAVRQIHHTMVIEGATPAALGLASVALNLFQSIDPNKEQPIILARNGGAEIIIGYVVGGLVGVLAGGLGAPFGGQLGSAVGAAVGAVIHACSGDDD